MFEGSRSDRAMQGFIHMYTDMRTRACRGVSGGVSGQRLAQVAHACVEGCEDSCVGTWRHVGCAHGVGCRSGQLAAERPKRPTCRSRHDSSLDLSLAPAQALVLPPGLALRYRASTLWRAVVITLKPSLTSDSPWLVPSRANHIVSRRPAGRIV